MGEVPLYLSLSRSLSLSLGVRPMVDPAQMAGSGVRVFPLAIAQRRERAPPLSFFLSLSLSLSLHFSLSFALSLSRSLALGVRPMVKSILARASHAATCRALSARVQASGFTKCMHE